MLIDPQLKLNAKPHRISLGLYQIGHWNFTDFECLNKQEWQSYPTWEKLGDYKNCYGVCDSPDQFMSLFGPTLADPQRQFFVSFVQLLKANEPTDGGWRWHKWGPYIGTQKTACEYLADESVIEEIWTYHVYEKIK